MVARADNVLFLNSIEVLAGLTCPWIHVLIDTPVDLLKMLEVEMAFDGVALKFNQANLSEIPLKLSAAEGFQHLHYCARCRYGNSHKGLDRSH